MILELLTALVLLHIFLTWALAVRRGLAARRRNAAAGPGDPPFHQPPVSILVPAWNEHDTIKRCIQALQQIEYPNWKAVVVAGGPDGTFAVAEALARQDGRLLVIEQAPRGKNAALADAMEHVDSRIVVLLDADSVVEPSWLTAMIATLEQGPAAVCGNYYPLRCTWVSRSEQMEKISGYLIHDWTILQGSGSIAVQHTALLQSGGFPAQVTVGVDWDLDTRLKEQGFQVGFARAAKVLTHRPATLREYWRNEIRWRRAHLASTWRHRRFYLQNPHSGLRQIFFYLMALAATGALILALTGLVMWFVAGTIVPTSLALLFLLWIAGRRAALAVEVAAFERNGRSLKDGWAPPALLFVAFAASLAALLTPGKLPVHFQGPRQTAPVQSKPSGST